MLTGDKKETAVNLAQAAGLLTDGHAVNDLCGSDEHEVFDKVTKRNYRNGPPLQKAAATFFF